MTDKDLHDLITDLSAQAYFVAKELDPKNAVAIWGKAAHTVVEACGLDPQAFDECPYAEPATV